MARNDRPHPNPLDQNVDDICYRWVPISTDQDDHVLAVKDEPQWHDGRSVEGTPASAEVISGELRCTLKALTPLFVGHDQYKANEVEGAKEVESAQDRRMKIQLPESWNVDVHVNSDKAVIEPLRSHSEDEPVLIQGSSLKGMLRQSLGALLNAPMERVQERTYSYRPNMGFGRGKTKYDYCCAVVEQYNRDTKHLLIKILAENAEIAFVRQDAYKDIGKPLPGELLNGIFKGVVKKKIPRGGKTYFKIIKDYHSNNALELNHRAYYYSGAIDGSGKLAKAFGLRGIYQCILVDEKTKGRTDTHSSIQVPKSIVQDYLKTQQHLHNTVSGHLRSGHPLESNLKKNHTSLKQVAKDVMRNADLKPNQLVYLEIEKDRNNNIKNIKSMGGHFRYRWRYFESVRKRANDQERSILSPLEVEKANQRSDEKHIAPSELSGARLLMGFVSGEKNIGTEGIGKGDYAKLGGRLAFNMAVEQVNKGEDEKERFMNPEKGCIVPLRILGSPKPSAVEHYLDQTKLSERNDSGTLVTYGDLRGDDPPGQLRGRKFYAHQPDVNKNPTHYQYADSEKDEIANRLSPLLRFVSKPDRTFRFTLRFRDLRPWELGAVLLAIDPNLINQAMDDSSRDRSKMKDKLAEWSDGDKSQPTFALKIGLARPLGLGSVQIHLNKKMCWSPAGRLESFDDSLCLLFEAFFEKLGDSRDELLCNWLDVHRYRGMKYCGYIPSNRCYDDVKEYHSKQRSSHAKGRRMKK